MINSNKKPYSGWAIKILQNEIQRIFLYVIDFADFIAPMGCAASAFEKDTLITVTADQRPIGLDNPRSAVSTKCATRVEESTDGSSSYQKVNQLV